MKKEILEAKKNRLAKLNEKLSQFYEINKCLPNYKDVKLIEDEIAKIEKELRDESLWHNPNPWVFRIVLLIIGAIIGLIISRFS